MEEKDSQQLNARARIQINSNSVMFIKNFVCTDYIDLLIMLCLKYIRGKLNDANLEHIEPQRAQLMTEANLKVRSRAIQFISLIFSNMSNNLRSSKLAAGIVRTILHQLILSIKQREYLVQRKLLNLMKNLMTVIYRRVNVNAHQTISPPNSTNGDHDQNSDIDSSQSTKSNILSRQASRSIANDQTFVDNMIYIVEPKIFSHNDFTHAIVSGIKHSATIKSDNMNIQLQPLKHFLDFTVFAVARIRSNLAHFSTSVLSCLCNEMLQNLNITHVRQIIHAMSLLIRKLVKDSAPNTFNQINEVRSYVLKNHIFFNTKQPEMILYHFC